MAIFATCATVSGQNTNLWNVNGNSTSNGNFLGTTNNEPLIFKTNSLEALRIKPNGDIKVAAFENQGKGVVTVNNNGVLNMKAYPNDTNQVFAGSGTFKSIAALSGWTRTGNVLYNAPGVHVGIGTSAPQYLLHVNGDAFFNGYVYATGVVLVNKMLVDTLQAGDIFSLNNNLHMGAGAINEIYTTTGPLRFQSNAGNSANTVFSAGTNGNVGIGTFNPQYKLDVHGSANVSGKLSVYRIVSNAGDSIIRIGDSTMTINYGWGNIANLNTNFNTTFKGMGIGELALGAGLHSTAIGYRVRAQAANSVMIGSRSTSQLVNNIANSLMVGFESNIATFFVGPSNGTGTVGRVGVGNTTPQADFQVGDTYLKLAAGRADGVQSMFNTSYIGFNVARNGSNQWLTSSDGIHNGGVMMIGDVVGGLRIVQFESTQGGSDHVWNNQDVEGHTIFQIKPGGRVIIGKNSQIGGALDDPFTMLTVDGGIVCRKLNVTLNNWADSVLAPGYYLMPLDSVADFIAVNGHLPGVPSEQDVKTNGSDLAQTDVILLAKVEELTLHMIQMEQRIAELEAKNQKLMEEKKEPK